MTGRSVPGDDCGLGVLEKSKNHRILLGVETWLEHPQSSMVFPFEANSFGDFAAMFEYHWVYHQHKIGFSATFSATASGKMDSQRISPKLLGFS